MPDRKLVLIANPEPRTVEMIFGAADWARLQELCRVVVHQAPDWLPDDRLEEALAQASVIVGQIALPAERLARCANLRAIINVEGNFTDAIDFGYCFAHDIRVLLASSVYAIPVAESALGMAIDLARGITANDRDFRRSAERWGLQSNDGRFSLYRAKVGIIGLGDLGLALRKLIAPFRCDVSVYDPWLPRSLVAEADCRPAALDEVLSTSQVLFIFAGVTEGNSGFLGREKLEKLPRGSVVLLMSRAAVVDFPAFVDLVAEGRFQAATDVFPVEPLSADDRVRRLEGMLLSAHRTGGLESAYREIGSQVVEDIDLILRGLPPRVCKRAEPETVRRLRSVPVERS